MKDREQYRVTLKGDLSYARETGPNQMKNKLQRWIKGGIKSLRQLRRILDERIIGYRSI
jgi:hypothetical protein